MFEAFLKIWFMIFLLPLMIFMEGSSKFAGYLKKKNIYQHWDLFHSILLLLVVVLVVLMVLGYR